MKNNKTVIILCAGMGKRLGIGVPKALLNINGVPLIIRILEKFDDIDDVRIVVGFNAEKVIETVLNYRKEVLFVFNHNYRNTGPAESVSVSLDGIKEYALIIDGDLVIHPDSVDMIKNIDSEFICGCKIHSENPVLLYETNGIVQSFEKGGNYEWAGICCIKKQNLDFNKKYVYEMISSKLPLNFLKIKVRDVDTITDYNNAKNWVENNYKDKLVLGVLGGMGTYATINLFNKYAEIFPAKKEWDRPRIIIDNNCTMPSRVRAFLYNENVEELINEMSSSLNHLIDAGANHIILACNTSHLFLNKIYEKYPKIIEYIFNIIDNCAKEIYALNIRDVYLLASEGTILSNIYKEYFDRYGINITYPDESDFPKLRICIEAVKQNKFTSEDRDIFLELTMNHENIILGCTELPIIYDKYSSLLKDKKIFDPLEMAIIMIKKLYY